MRVKTFIMALLVCMTVLFGSWFWSETENRLSGNNPLPENIDIAYKEVQMRGTARITRCAIIDTAGRNYFVTKEKFEMMDVLQKIGEGLYRMPNGTLLTKVDK